MARIATKQLARLCRRIGTGLHAGLDARSVWDKEAQRGPAAQRAQLAEVSRRLSAGDSLAEAMADSNGFFPPLTCEMVKVGEATGRLEAVLLRLADHYDHLLEMRRNFVAGITWPAIQLAATVVIVGFLIWIMGMINSMMGGEGFDLLGLGLSGTMGLLVYLLFVAAAIGAFTFLIAAFSRRWLWTRPLMRIVMKVPVVGDCFKLMALSRMAWSLGMAIDTGMDAIPSVRLAVRSTQNTYYMSQLTAVEQALEDRGQMHEALRDTGVFPDDFLDTLETGEMSGLVTESMNRLSTNYQQQAQSKMRLLTVVAGFLCWGFVALVIILVILRIALSYIGLINDLLDGI